MKPKHQRLTFLIVGLVLIASATALILTQFEENIVFFYSPADTMTKPPATGDAVRVGGLVREGSVEKSGAMDVRFVITDYVADILIHYQGELPALFREGQGIVAEGHFTDDGVFQAKTILAKHDENYMPPEVAGALKKSGHWQNNTTKPATNTSPPTIPSK